MSPYVSPMSRELTTTWDLQEGQIKFTYEPEMVQFVSRKVERQAPWGRSVAVDLPDSPPRGGRQGTK